MKPLIIKKSNTQGILGVGDYTIELIYVLMEDGQQALKSIEWKKILDSQCKEK